MNKLLKLEPSTNVKCNIRNFIYFEGGRRVPKSKPKPIPRSRPRKVYRSLIATDGEGDEGIPTAHLFEPQENIEHEDENWVADAMRQYANPMVPLQSIIAGYFNWVDFKYAGDLVARTDRNRGRHHWRYGPK